MQQSPFENIFNIIGGITEGNEKPMKHGFYNAFALFILAICCVAVYVLFLILEPFFKPLFWALLVGSLLHPFKYKLSKKLKSWFEDLEKSNTSVVVGLMVIPMNVVNYASDTVGQQFIDHYKTVIGLLSAIFVLPWLYNAVPRSLVCIFWQFSSFISFSTTLLISVCSSYITLTIFLAYIISVYILWTPQRATLFRITSHMLWLVISSFIASLTGSLQVYTFVFLQAICITGFTLQVLDVHKKLLEKDPEASLILAFFKTISNDEDVEKKVEDKPEEVPIESSEQESTPEKDSPSPVTPESLVKRGSWASNEPIQSSPRHPKMLFKTRTLSALPLSNPKIKCDTRFLNAFKQRSLDENYIKNNFDNDEETALYFKLLFFGCLCMLVWKHIWLLPVTLFFLAIHVMKRLLDYFGVWLFFENHYNNIMGKIKGWWKLRQSALLPAHVRGLGKMASVCNASFRDMGYSSVDTVSTCIVIVGLILFLTVASVFIFIQIYSEAIVVVQLSGSLLNSTYVQNSELHAYLPEGWEEKLDSLIDNAYTYGREGISTAIQNVVKSILKEGDPEKINRVEQQILELWDRVYQSWVSGHFTSTVGPQVDGAAIQDSWDNLVNDVSNAPGIVAWVQANVGTLSAIATSIWAPLASNVSLLAGSVGAFTSLLLCGGSALINMFINLVVFFTTLFYLLASSNALYKPVEVITQVQPNFGPRLGIALSVAINQVFRASFKMALFYGLWTWLVHNLFGAKVVYLPSVLAAVLGAAPFLGPYLAGIPAALDVWLQGRPMAALLLPIAQAAPIAFLDAAVYAEIKDGGHPYVTGLAIAGGIFYLGPEGAILGPLLLCCLMVVLNLSSTFLRDTPSEERAALHSRVRSLLGCF
ncbi:transmembrane protein 245 isoform X4 [Spodoptera frugiperda]|uniref:Transmembrane protein 245 isoform X4 n=1 Tax=Spodoptera frugiperda TaxID=7108 RepID=A0A9R0DR54_SPOFR|nr:transmembrane protein 245 isoform X4 [Spodoptera frugiperda]